MELKKYEIGNKITSSSEYLFNRGWSICDDGFIYITNLNNRYGWSYKIKYGDSLKTAFKNAHGTQAELDVLDDAVGNPAAYGLSEKDVISSPSTRFTPCDFQDLEVGDLKAILIDGVEDWIRVDEIPDRVFFDTETCDYVDSRFNYIDVYDAVVFVKYDIGGEEYKLAIASDAQFEGPRGEEKIAAQAVDEDGTEFLVYWDVAEDWQDSDEDMTHAADWDNPVGITKA